MRAGGFRDRRHAGDVLAEELRAAGVDKPANVYGLARGGVVVAARVARALELPLDVLVVRKLGVPWHPELAMGAIAEGGSAVMNAGIVADLGISAEEIDQVVSRETVELERRCRAYRGERRLLSPAGSVAIVVDDGLATGATARAAVEALRAMGARQVIVAVPVGAVDTVALLAETADRVVCPSTPARFQAVGLWYEDFGQVTDSEVRRVIDNR